MIEELEALVREWREHERYCHSLGQRQEAYAVRRCADQLEATIAIIKREKGDA